MSKHKVELGDLVRDEISGFEGIVYGIITYLTGCDRADVRPTKLTKENKIADSYYFDVATLKILKKGKLKVSSFVKEEDKALGKVGGPPTKVQRY